MSRQLQRERSKAMRESILNAAIKIEDSEGIEKVTVRRIGEMIGYSTGVIYYHFKDKQNIIDEIEKKLDREAYYTVKSFIDTDSSAREILKNICLNIYKMSKEQPGEYNRLFVNRKIQSKGQEIWIELIMEVLERSAAEGDISPKNLRFKASCILSYIIGCNMMFIECNRGMQIDLSKYADLMVDIIINGLCNVE